MRQGDPLSPYLFTLVMEVFTLIMQRESVGNDKFKYHVGCKGIKLTHLCFADDLLVVCHGNVESVKVVKSASEEFSRISGLYPNVNKSTIFFCSVNADVQEEIKNELAFNVGKLPVRYLGVPLVSKKIGVKECKGLISKVTSRVTVWKKKMFIICWKTPTNIISSCINKSILDDSFQTPFICN